MNLTQPLVSLAKRADRSHLTREIATDSATGFAMAFGVPADVVVRYVLTGEVTP